MKKKIYININGRLGNQMFQYAFARKLQMKYNLKTEIVINFYLVNNMLEKESTGWEDSLKYFNTEYDTTNESPFTIFFKRLTIKQKILAIIYQVYKRIHHIEIFDYEKLSSSEKKWARFFYHGGLYIMPSNGVGLINSKKNIVLNGKFEDSTYYEDIKDVLRKDFTPNFPVLEQNMDFFNKVKSSNSICLSIRRGDYLISKNKKNFYVCGEDYFLKAINIMSRKVQEPVFFLFSDDVEYAEEFAKKFLEKLNYDFYIENSGNPVWEKLRLMSNCKHFIISNSTFSWWCQFLSTNDNKVVVSPKKWNNSKYSSNKLINKDFIKI